MFARAKRWLLVLIVFGVAPATGGSPAGAQDLEPRAFAPAPIGMNFAVVGYGYATGNMLFDSALPAEDVEGTVHDVSVGYLRTLNFFGATAKLAGVLPVGWGDWSGLWQGEPATASRRGLADPAINLSVDFIGAPARSLKEIATYKEGTVVGAAILIRVPLGQYDPEKLLNLGTNRWAFRTRLGVSQRLRRLNLELIGELWSFTRNHEAFGGVNIDQAPILAIQANAVYRFGFRRGTWMAAGWGYGAGGKLTISGEQKDTGQENHRFGVTFVLPVTARNSLKFVFLNALSTAIGADFNRGSVAWQVRWGGGV